jgi:hypothetical protein
MVGMHSPASLLVASCLVAALLTGCQPNSDGEALLFNETGEQGLHVVVRRPDGVRLEDGPLEKAYSFDTQWVERVSQCYVGSDGSFEVLRPDGDVVVHHEFADRPVCGREEIALTADGDLIWLP